MIETAFEDECNKDGIKSVFSLCYNYLKRYAKQKYDKITKKLAFWMKNECLKTILLPALGVCILFAIIGLGAYLEFYLEISLFAGCILFELLILFICWYKGYFFNTYTTTSILKCVTKLIFTTVLLYVYDYASDGQVIFRYTHIKSCNDTVVPILTNRSSLNQCIKRRLNSFEWQNTTIGIPKKEHLLINEMSMLIAVLIAIMVLTGFLTSQTVTQSDSLLITELKANLKINAEIKNEAVCDRNSTTDSTHCLSKRNYQKINCCKKQMKDNARASGFSCALSESQHKETQNFELSSYQATPGKSISNSEEESNYLIEMEQKDTLALQDEISVGKKSEELESDYCQDDLSNYLKPEIPILDLLKRNDMSINEASVESTLQFVVQWIVYFTMCYWLDLALRVQKKYESNTSTIIPISTLQKYNYSANLTIPHHRYDEFTEEEICGLSSALTFDILGKSTIISVFSLSLSQMKSNNIQHELSTTFIQKFFYFLASFLNTISHLSLFTLFGTQLFQLIQTIDNWILSMSSLSIFCTVIVSIKIIVNVMIIFLSKPFSRINSNDCFLFKLESENCFPLLDHLFNFDGFVLPTSQSPSIDPQTQQLDYSSYNIPIEKSPKLLMCFIRQCLLYTIFIVLNCILSFLNNYLIINDGEFALLTDSIDITDSEISVARKNFYIFCACIIPIGWCLSNLLLYFYFRFDEGYFCMADIQFCYERSDSKYTFKANGKWLDVFSDDENDHEHEEKADLNEITTSFIFYNTFNEEENVGIYKYVIVMLGYVGIGVLCFCIAIPYVMLVFAWIINRH